MEELKRGYCLTGRVGKDPEVVDAHGTPVLKFPLAENYGQDFSKTQWHYIVCFDGNIDLIEELGIEKGDLIKMLGDYRSKDWVTNSGHNRKDWSFIPRPDQIMILRKNRNAQED